MPMSASTLTLAAKPSRETTFRPAVEGDGVGVAERVAQPGETDGRATGEILGHVQPREGFDFVVADAFALQPRPRPGGVDAAEVAATIEFAREFKVMEDAEDGLDDLHEFGGPQALLSLARAEGCRLLRSVMRRRGSASAVLSSYRY